MSVLDILSEILREIGACLSIAVLSFFAGFGFYHGVKFAGYRRKKK